MRRKCKIKAKLNTVLYPPDWINIDLAIPSVGENVPGWWESELTVLSVSADCW